MNMLKKSLFTAGFASIATIFIAAPVFASIQTCIDKYYPELSTEYSDTHPVRCMRIQEGEGNYITVYSKTSADCVKVSSIAADPDCGEEEDPVPDEPAPDDYKSYNGLESTFSACVGEGNAYPDLSLTRDDEYIIQCPVVTDKNGTSYTLYAKKSFDCESIDTIKNLQPYDCTGYGKVEERDGEWWLMLVIFLVIVAVVITSIVITLLHAKRKATEVINAVKGVQNGASTQDDGQRYFMYPDTPANPGQPNVPNQPVNPNDPYNQNNPYGQNNA